MKTTLLILAFCIPAYAFADEIDPTQRDPSDYQTAVGEHRAYEQRGELSVIANPALTFSTDGTISRLAAQGDNLALFFEDGRHMGITTLSISSLGVRDAEISMEGFMRMVFLEPFPAPVEVSPEYGLLHAVREFKRLSFENNQPRYFIRGPLTVFYFEAAERSQYKIYVVDSRNPDLATMLDVFGYSQRSAANLLSSIHHHPKEQ